MRTSYTVKCRCANVLYTRELKDSKAFQALPSFVAVPHCLREFGHHSNTLKDDCSRQVLDGHRDVAKVRQT